MLSIITPCYRQSNLKKLYESINFDKIDKWIIVYDTSKDRKYEYIYVDNPKIIETECTGGVYGHPQRNHGMKLVDDGFIYFLDDDNIIHPDFWSIVSSLDDQYFYTFDQLRNKYGGILYGNNIKVKHIDTAMYIVHKKHIKDILFKTNLYDADGHFICDILRQNAQSHIYIQKIACYYNHLQ